MFLNLVENTIGRLGVSCCRKSKQQILVAHSFLSALDSGFAGGQWGEDDQVHFSPLLFSNILIEAMFATEITLRFRMKRDDPSSDNKDRLQQSRRIIALSYLTVRSVIVCYLQHSLVHA